MIQFVQMITFLIRASLAAVLIASGAAKLADVRSFANTLKGLGLPVHHRFLNRFFVMAVPLLEVVLGVALVSGLWAVVINSVVLGLMCSFNIVIFVALHKNLRITCRCFGALSDSQFSGKALFRSLFLTALAMIVLWSGNTYSLRLDESAGIVALLVAGYVVFGIAAAQASQSIAMLKERMSS